MSDQVPGQEEDEGIINTQQLLNDMNHVKNQLHCEIINLKGNNSQHPQSSNTFFNQRNPLSLNQAASEYGSK